MGLLGPIDSGQNNTAPRKVIHDPSPEEIKQVIVTLGMAGFTGPQISVLLMGESIFDQYWVSLLTQNWLAVLKSDMELLEQCTDRSEMPIYSAMVELDYHALLLSLGHDAVRAKALKI